MNYSPSILLLAATLSLGTNSYGQNSSDYTVVGRGQWVESNEEIVLQASGAAATNGSHQVYFPSGIDTDTTSGTDHFSGLQERPYQTTTI